MSPQPGLAEVPHPPEPDLVERIAAALPAEVRADYYREVSHCRALPESDEMLRVLRAMQFLALLMHQAPGQVAAERQKLEQVLVGALDAMQAMHQSGLAYHQQLESRLRDLPEEIVSGVDSSVIAYRLADVLQQRFAESGIPKCAQALAAASLQIKQVTGEFHIVLSKMSRRETLQGALDLLVLQTLARGPQHGYGITCHILAASESRLRVEEGPLYPVLHRMEAAGLIQASWKPSENNRRERYYSLTRTGRKRLEKAVRDWRDHTAAVDAFLNFA